MSFSSPRPKEQKEPEKPAEPVFVAEAADEAAEAQRRIRRRSGVVSTFLGGAQGQPGAGVIGKLGLTGSV